MVDEAGQPVSHVRYRIRASDGATREGFLDGDGLARVEGLPSGQVSVSFPDLDESAWAPV
jgi:hypothetical protein